MRVLSTKLPTQLKREQFVKEVVKSGNATKAYKTVFNACKRKSATERASQLMAIPNVRAEIIERMNKKGLTDDFIFESLGTATTTGLGQHAKNADAIRALELMIKLKDYMPINKRQSVSMRFDYSKMDRSILLDKAKQHKELWDRIFDH